MQKNGWWTGSALRLKLEGMSEVTHADFFSFVGLVVKVVIAIIGVRLVIMVMGIRMHVPIVDPAIDAIRGFLVSLGLPGISF